MKLSLAGGSLLLFGLSVVVWVMLTLFEPTLVGISLTAERVFTFLLLVFSGGMGTMLGATSLVRKDGCTWLAATGLALNILFAAFHLMVILFAG